MENKIESVLSAESKADALQVEAREEGEKKLHQVRAGIEDKRSKLNEELSQKHENAVEKARKAAKETVEKLREKEEEEAKEVRSKGEAKLEKASELILEKLIEEASAFNGFQASDGSKTSSSSSNEKEKSEA